MRRNLFLYLALACFIGLVAIFIFDGYLGVYDTIHITSGERPEKIEADYWLRQGGPVLTGEKSSYYTSVNRDEKVFFRYEVDNRKSSSYTATVEVTVWRRQEKVRDLLSQSISVASFGKEQVEWTIDNAELVPDDLPAEQGYEYTVIIKRGEIERNIIIYVSQSPYPINPVPVPVR